MNMTNQRNNQGFTIEQIYSFVGRCDNTANIVLRNGSTDEELYGKSLVGVFTFSKAERDNLELRITNSENESYGKVKFCCYIPELSESQTNTLKNQGIETRNIVSINWVPCTITENIYPSRQKRSLTPIKIASPIISKDDKMIWTYELLKRLVQEGVGLCPEERNRLLAYKTILEQDKLTDDEKSIIYDKNGTINEDIAFECLRHKFFKFSITRKEMKRFGTILANRYHSRALIINDELARISTSYEGLQRDNATIADYIMTKVQSFNQKRYNTKGKYPLYLDVQGYVHILLRHVEEAKFENGFGSKTKFQYDENDIEVVMRDVLSIINEDYQKFKESYPSDSFVRKNEDSYYYNGDYYAIIVNPDGSIVTFYKRGSLEKN